MSQPLVDKHGVEFKVGQVRKMKFASGGILRVVIIDRINKQNEGMETFRLFDTRRISFFVASIGVMEHTELICE